MFRRHVFSPSLVQPYLTQMDAIIVENFALMRSVETQNTIIISYATITNNFEAQWLLYAPPQVTFTNSTFCPHSVFMCFVWI